MSSDDLKAKEDDISHEYYIDKNKKIVRYTPEKSVSLIKYIYPVWKVRFPPPPNPRDLEKLQLTTVGIYSITQPPMIEEMVKAIKEGCKRYGLTYENLTATETHAGVGGMSMRLARDLKHVNLVEINPIHANVIKNNLGVYNINPRKYKIIQDDYLNVFDKLEQDIIISDPPWGGTNYYENKKLRLGVDNIDIVYFINTLYYQKKIKMFVLFVPVNYDMDSFKELLAVPDVFVHETPKHFFILGAAAPKTPAV